MYTIRFEKVVLSKNILSSKFSKTKNSEPQRIKTKVKQQVRVEAKLAGKLDLEKLETRKREKKEIRSSDFSLKT